MYKLFRFHLFYTLNIFATCKEIFNVALFFNLHNYLIYKISIKI